jgi:hypothetical protein
MVVLPSEELLNNGGTMANRRITKKKNKRMEQKAAAVTAAAQPVKAEAPVKEIVKKTAETPAEEVVKKSAKTSAAPAKEAAKAEAKETKTKTAAKKSRLFVQFKGHEFEEKEIIAAVKQKWKEAGNMVKDLKELDLYVKPEEGKIYYRINGEFSGNIALI